MDEIDHECLVVEEFDALKIDIKTETPSPASSDKYPAKLHARKVASEFEAEHGIKNGLIFLPGEPSRLYEDSDQSPPFRQRRYFYYLSGANFPGCAVTYDIERDTLILWIPYVEPRQVLWYGSTPSPKECLGRSDVDDVRYIDRINDYISDLLRYGSTDTLYVLHPYQIPGIQDGRGFRIDSSKLLLCMDAARVIKSDYEVAMIRRANKVSSAAHREIARRLRKLKNEREIEAIFRASCTAAGAPAQAYPIIAGSGTNAATLHYDDNNQDLAGKQLLVLDAGCEWDCYASDITRTLPLDGKFSPEAAEIHALVTHMQEKCIASVKPGAVYYQIHLKACQIALMGLMRLSILRGGTVSEIWNAGTVAAFFPHGLGHHVGLETHDVTGRQRLLFDCEAETIGKRTRIRKRLFVSPEMEGPPPPYKGRQILEPNMIVTIEPGIYFCRAYLDGYFLGNPTHSKYINKGVLEKYYDVGGVRIEDDLLVTKTGNENLTTAPKGEELLRIINGERD